MEWMRQNNESYKREEERGWKWRETEFSFPSTHMLGMRKKVHAHIKYIFTYFEILWDIVRYVILWDMRYCEMWDIMRYCEIWVIVRYYEILWDIVRYEMWDTRYCDILWAMRYLRYYEIWDILRYLFFQIYIIVVVNF
jgi:hypothetical protein